MFFTFDDGFSSVYELAYPLIKKYKIKTMIFLITDYIGKAEMPKNMRPRPGCSFLTWEQIFDMYNSGLVKFGSHTATHKVLTECSKNEVYEELKKSKETLEDKLGVPIVDICYPKSKVNKMVIEIAQKVGYKRGYLTWPFFKKSCYPSTIMTMPRIGVYAKDNLLRLMIKLVIHKIRTIGVNLEWNLEEIWR